MPASLLPVSASPCPECGTSLVVDEERRSCPRCGRDFVVAATAVPQGGVYREAQVVDLVAVQDRAPLSLSIARLERAIQRFFSSDWRVSLGLKKDKPETSLDITFGGAMSRLVPATRMLAVLLFIAINALKEIGFDDWLLWPFLGLLLFNVIVGKFSQERLIVRPWANGLIWQQLRGGKVVGERAVELTRVTGIYNSGDHIRVDVEDGTVWQVGKGLGLPRRVRKAIVQRVAERLPRPGEGEHALTDGNTGIEEERRLCSDEGCIGIIDPGGKCQVCGRVLQPAAGASTGAIVGPR